MSAEGRVRNQNRDRLPFTRSVKGKGAGGLRDLASSVSFLRDLPHS